MGSRRTDRSEAAVDGGRADASAPISLPRAAIAGLARRSRRKFRRDGRRIWAAARGGTLELRIVAAGLASVWSLTLAEKHAVLLQVERAELDPSQIASFLALMVEERVRFARIEAEDRLCLLPWAVWERDPSCLHGHRWIDTPLVPAGSKEETP